MRELAHIQWRSLPYDDKVVVGLPSQLPSQHCVHEIAADIV